MYLQNPSLSINIQLVPPLLHQESKWCPSGRWNYLHRYYHIFVIQIINSLFNSASFTSSIGPLSKNNNIPYSDCHLQSSQISHDPFVSYLSGRRTLFLIWRNIINNKSKIRHNMDMEQPEATSSLETQPLTDHHFVLRGSETTNLQEDVIVDFQPVKALDPSISAHRFITFSITPTFNQDGKYYTTAFLNPFDDELEEDDKMMTQHQTKVREFSTEIPQNDILLPKPRQANPFCCVCKQVYRDYLEHINTGKHRKAIKSSRWGRMIEGLVEESFPKVRRSQRIICRCK